MIEHLMIITEAGLPIFFRSYSSTEINHILLSGFLSAIDEYAKSGMNSAVQQIQFDNRYITMRRKKLNRQGGEISFILVHQHCLGFRRQGDCVCVPSSLEEISSEFFARFIDHNSMEIESVDNRPTNLAVFSGFGNFIDSVIKKHFLNHSIESDFSSDLELIEIEEISDHNFLGTISFLNDQLFKFHLDATFSSPKFHKLIALVGIWSEFLGKEQNLPSITVLDLKDFKVASSLKIIEPSEKLTIFTLFASEASVEQIRSLHNNLCETFFSKSINSATNIEKH
ncbi:MAG: hypothetical protein ACXAC8_05085 [Candidatus Hodarchaeales archaeon]